MNALHAQARATPPAEKIEEEILELQPKTETQRWLKSEALKLTEEVLRTRWRLLSNASGSVPRTFLIVVIFWLSMTFASFGLSAPRNATVVTVFVISTLSVAAAVFLILELDGGLKGIIRIFERTVPLHALQSRKINRPRDLKPHFKIPAISPGQ